MQKSPLLRGDSGPSAGSHRCSDATLTPSSNAALASAIHFGFSSLRGVRAAVTLLRSSAEITGAAMTAKTMLAGGL
jgi:hypothetical protein